MPSKSAKSKAIYRIIGGSVRGRTHRHNGLPNQDAYSFPKQLEHGSLAVAISDGHGSKLHFRSNIGSHAAAIAGRKTLEKVLTATKSSGNKSAALHDLVTTRVPRTIYSDWKRRIDADLRDFPFNDFDFCGLSDSEELEVRRRPLLAYGSTLLAATIGKEFVALARIGDGSIVMIDSDGTPIQPLPELASSGDESTHSLCQQDATSLIATHCSGFSAGPPRCILLATDGYTKSFGSAAAADEGLVALYEHAKQHGVEDLAANFQPMLQETTHSGSGDDTTVAMLVNLAALPNGTQS